MVRWREAIGGVAFRSVGVAGSAEFPGEGITEPLILYVSHTTATQSVAGFALGTEAVCTNRSVLPGKSAAGRRNERRSLLDYHRGGGAGANAGGADEGKRRREGRWNSQAKLFGVFTEKERCVRRKKHSYWHYGAVEGGTCRRGGRRPTALPIVCEVRRKMRKNTHILGYISEPVISETRGGG